MKILVIGNGGREHALAWRLAASGHEVLAAPGNPGIARVARCVPIGVEDHRAIVDLALSQQVALVVVGPEAPLVLGLADSLRQRGVPTFGPGAAGARLEGSKVFAKQFFWRHGIPTAPFEIVHGKLEADDAIARLLSLPNATGAAVSGCVVKADGLAAGKGVVVAATAAAARTAAYEMLDGRFGDAGRELVIEQKLPGREVSVLALTDGQRLEVLPAAEDHKTIFDGDRGPNTGGMGTVSPAWASGAVLARITREILEPTVAGLAKDGIDYRGVLYAGVMVDASGAPWLLEYNCRFGDPETQPILARLRGDFGAALLGAATGALATGTLAWDPRAAICVVVAAHGYPGRARTGDSLHGPGIDRPAPPDTVVFHAGTGEHEGRLVTTGGRVLGVTALGSDVAQARARAYAVVDAIELDGKQVRRDIGARER